MSRHLQYAGQSAYVSDIFFNQSWPLKHYMETSGKHEATNTADIIRKDDKITAETTKRP